MDPTGQRVTVAIDRRAGLGAVARLALSEYLVLALTACYLLAALPLAPGLASSDGLGNVFANMLPLLAVATGQTIVLITGGIDLSVTAIIVLSSVTGAWVMNGADGWLANHPLAVPAAIAMMLAVGAGVGAFNGLAVALLGMPSFIVTLTTMMFAGGWAIWRTQSRNIPNLPEAFTNLGYGDIAGIPYAALIVLALALAAHLMLSRTLLGRWLYAVGMSARAARVSGVPVRRTIVLAYVASGLCAAVASIIYAARLETGSPTLVKETLLLDVVGAAVIGGTSLLGGKGKIPWTACGVLLFTLLAVTLNLWGFEYFTIMMIKGGVILLAASLDRLRARIAGA